jgi:hypothetical protein
MKRFVVCSRAYHRNVFAGFGSALFLAVVLPVSAQVPSEFTNLYSELQGYLTNFAATLDAGWNGEQTNCLMAATLMPATSSGRGWGVNGTAATDTNFLNDTVVPYLNGLQALGIKTMKFAIQFPVLYQPYYTNTSGEFTPSGFTNTFNFYTNLVALLRQRGLGIIIPTENMLVQNGSPIAAYYGSLTTNQYIAGRSAVIQTIARFLKPDYIILQSEPDTEAIQFPGTNGFWIKDPVQDTNMIATFLSDLQAAGLRTTNTLIGAGFGTSQSKFNQFLTAFTHLPGLDLLDVHVYGINTFTNAGVLEDDLARLLQMADAAHANGLRIGMGECWFYKQANSEMNTGLGGDTYRGRNVYSFWSPLDREFLLCMIKAGHWKQLDFVDPYWTSYFFNYLDYYQLQPTVQAMTNSGSTLDQVGAFLVQSNFQAVSSQFPVLSPTDCGRGYAEYIAIGLPVLRITNNVAGSVRLGWSPVAIRFLAEQKAHLSDSNWTSVSIPPRAAGNDFVTTISKTNATGFYRLRKPLL